MGKMKMYYEECHPYVFIAPRRRYGFFSFIFDIFMIVITCGLWIIWIFVREMRNR